MSKKLIYLIFFCIIFLSEGVRADEKRGMWIVRYALINDNTDEIISSSNSLGITDLYVQVRALNKNFYTINDNFKNLVNAAHKSGIKVHAWINVLYIGSGDKKIGGTEPFIKSLLRKKYSVPEYKELKKKGIEGYFIHPLDKENLNIILTMADELIDDYDVDGIHLDYFRYPSLEYSFSPTGRTRFMITHYYDPIMLFENGGRLEKNNQFLYKEYSRFLKNELTDALRIIKNRCSAHTKKIILSIAVKPDADIAESKYFQSWREWIRKNYCDYVILMNYNADNRIFERNLKKAQSIGLYDKIMVGVAAYNQGWRAFLQKYRMVLNSPMYGSVIFSFNYLSEHTSYLNHIKNELSTGGHYGKN